MRNSIYLRKIPNFQKFNMQNFKNKDEIQFYEKYFNKSYKIKWNVREKKKKIDQHYLNFFLLFCYQEFDLKHPLCNFCPVG